MNVQKIYRQLNACEIAAQLVLEECRKTRTLLDGADRSAARKGVASEGVFKARQSRKGKLLKQQN